MVPPVNGVSAEVKEPVPVLFVVFVVNDTVGLVDVLQTTPLLVTDAPPSEVTLPPLFALVTVIPLITVVLIVGRVTGVTAVDAEEGAELPTALVATTVKV